MVGQVRGTFEAMGKVISAIGGWENRTTDYIFYRTF